MALHFASYGYSSASEAARIGAVQRMRTVTRSQDLASVFSCAQEEVKQIPIEYAEMFGEDGYWMYNQMIAHIPSHNLLTKMYNSKQNRKHGP